MKLRRHKQFLRDWNKTKITDGQFAKLIQFFECLRLNEPLPAESKDHSLSGEY
jgi:mRNA interferase YafQ